MPLEIETQANASIAAFMRGLIDYAGLFPPARLPLDDAITRYARYRQEVERWMLARFIIPVARLPELDAFASLFTADDPFSFSVLVGGGADRAAVIDALKRDMSGIAAFQAQYGAAAQVDVVEARLPDMAGWSGPEVVAVVEEVTGIISDSGLIAFYEVPFTPGWETTIKYTIETLEGANQRGAAGFKLRCGGTDAAAFPTPEQVALALAICRGASVSLKCTAGLHHPVRHYSDDVDTTMHGFFNVFGAGILAHVHDLAPAQVESIIVDEDASHFVFTDDAFTWQGLSVTPEQITAARRLLVSYGSCSFDEPRDDLRNLNLL